MKRKERSRTTCIFGVGDGVALIQVGDGVHLYTRSKTQSRRKKSLPAELEDEILIRLPVKPLIRFQSVCKEWQSKLNSKSFNDLFRQRTKNKSEPKTMKLEALYKMAPKLKRSPTLFGGVGLGTKVSVIGPSSNGIYCLTSVPMDESARFSPSSVALWRSRIALCNPGIHHFKFLPPFPVQFDPELSQASTGKNRLVSGFLHGSSGCIHVVVVINYAIRRYFGFFIVFAYSSYSQEWKKLVDYTPGRDPAGSPSATWVFTQRIRRIIAPTEVCSQKLLNGCWHWMVQLQYNGRPFMILSFNFAEQSFNLIQGPTIGYVTNDDLMRVDVLVLHDHLAVIYRLQNDQGRTIEVSVWMMMDYGVQESWTMKFKACPNYEGVLSALYRINYIVHGSDDVFINGLFFTCTKSSGNKEIISLDRHGRHRVTSHRYDPSKDISFGTGGISSYKETLERVH